MRRYYILGIKIFCIAVCTCPYCQSFCVQSIYVDVQNYFIFLRSLLIITYIIILPVEQVSLLIVQHTLETQTQTQTDKYRNQQDLVHWEKITIWKLIYQQNQQIIQVVQIIQFMHCLIFHILINVCLTIQKQPQQLIVPPKANCLYLVWKRILLQQLIIQKDFQKNIKILNFIILKMKTIKFVEENLSIQQITQALSFIKYHCTCLFQKQVKCNLMIVAILWHISYIIQMDLYKLLNGKHRCKDRNIYNICMYRQILYIYLFISLIIIQKYRFITRSAMRTVIQFHKLILLFLSLLSATSEVTVSIQDSYKNIVPIYTNNMLSQQFNYNQNIFCCYNHYIFTYNQTYSQYQANTPYNLYISNITSSQPVLPISISITTYNVFRSRLKPTLSSTTCLPPSCTIAIYNNCQKQQSYDAYQISISNIPIITYNVLCNTNITISPFQGGLIILVCICVAQIIINSMFQQANSFNNKGHYINWMSILIFCIVTIIGQILILVPFSNRMYPLEVLQYTTMVLSFLGSIIGIWVCVCQFLYYTKIGIFRRSLNLRKFKIRLMDIVGIVIGIVLFLYWAFVNINWIISDIMYFAMCTAIIKFIKFDSLRIATFMFICVAGIDLFFILFLQFYQHQYFNNIIMTYFNNPFFIMCPIINYVPNQQCSWFFIGSVAFPGILLAYFRRFDQNNGSRIYTTIFIVIYCIFSAVWIGIIFVTPIVFPYNMINSPICIVVIVIFAKKRGEIYQLWTGKIYDAKHKNRKQAEKEIQNMIKSQKTHTYNTQLFKINLSISSSGTQEMQQNLRNFQLKETILRENTSMKNCRSSI